VRVTLVTVGDPQRRTGGYRYHARVLSRLAARGIRARQVAAGPADRAGQMAAAAVPPADDGADVLVVDALARIAAQPWIARRAGRPVVGLVHELPSTADPGGASPADEEALLGCDLLVAVSPSVRDTLTRRGVPAERIRIVPPGYDRHCSNVGLRRRMDDMCVLCVAQWIPRKGIRELLQAWRAGDRSGARLVLVGETDPEPAYAAEVHALLTDDVEVLGSVDDVILAQCYAHADLFALPSVAEGYGIVYAEALACGVPILACATGPVPDLVGDAGILVPPGDAGAVAAALDTLLTDRPLRMRLAHNARRRAARLPTWDDCADGFLAVLEEAAR
jgi:glycosyltransferase involved in cell wall biosynthesis